MSEHVPKTGLMLINLGTPDSPRVPDVRRYLREFLSDPRVIDISPIGRWLLLNLIILPFRPRKSARAYQSIWTERGSPLLFHGQDLLEKVRKRLGDGFHIEFAMRYQNPSIAAVLKRFQQRGIDRIMALPMFPHNSSSAYGSAVEKLYAETGKLWNVPSIQVAPPFYDHPAFIEAWASVARPVLEELQPEKLVMSFHGLPERHIIKGDESGGNHCLRSERCCDTIVHANRNCYRAQCFCTARAIADRLGVSDDDCTVTFQSRLGRSPWIKPYTDHHIRDLARRGVKRVAVLCPAFVSDCLETLEEIGDQAAADFKAHGGEELRLVPSLNSNDAWADAVVRMVRDMAWCGSSPDEPPEIAEERQPHRQALHASHEKPSRHA